MVPTPNMGIPPMQAIHAYKPLSKRPGNTNSIPQRTSIRLNSATNRL